MAGTAGVVQRHDALSRWFSFPRPNRQASLRLFCFPYAGGGAVIYRTWPAGLPKEIEVCAAQLPGRGNRHAEPLYDRLEPLVEALVPAILPHLDKPFAFFGHSMGALISFELARRLRSLHRVEPLRLFISGRSAPQTPKPERRTYDLPEREFVEELRRLNGTPQQLLEEPEVLQIALPMLRADFAICQTYQFLPGPPLSCPLTVFGGLQDQEMGRAGLEAWRDQTTGPFALRMLPGDHFFLHTSQTLLLQWISQGLSRFISDGFF